MIEIVRGNMIEIVPFEVEHARNLPGLRNDAAAFDALSGSDEYLERLEAAGVAFSCFADEGLIGCGGLGVYWPGVAEGWLLLTPLADRYRFTLHRTCKRKLDELEATMNLHRIQATVRAGDDRARRWIESLGFVHEGLMRGYGPDRSDYERYARCRF